MNLAEFVEVTYNESDWHVRKRIVCNDGFSMSVQGNKGAYCSPRSSEREYDTMEIGYPSEKEELIMEYAESPDNPTGTVYGYVPVSVIQQVIDKHNGISFKQTMRGL